VPAVLAVVPMMTVDFLLILPSAVPPALASSLFAGLQRIVLPPLLSVIMQVLVMRLVPVAPLILIANRFLELFAVRDWVFVSPLLVPNSLVVLLPPLFVCRLVRGTLLALAVALIMIALGRHPPLFAMLELVVV